MFKVLQENIDASVAPIFEQHKNYTSFLMEKANEKGFSSVPAEVLKTLRSKNYDAIQDIYSSFGQIGQNLFAKGDAAKKILDVERNITQKYSRNLETSMPSEHKKIQHQEIPSSQTTVKVPYSTAVQHAPTERNTSSQAHSENKSSQISQGENFIPQDRNLYLHGARTMVSNGAVKNTPTQRSIPDMSKFSSGSNQLRHASVSAMLTTPTPQRGSFPSADSMNQAEIPIRTDRYGQEMQNRLDLSSDYHNQSARHSSEIDTYDNGYRTVTDRPVISEPKKSSMYSKNIYNNKGQMQPSASFAPSYESNNMRNANLRVASLAGLHSPSMNISSESNGQQHTYLNQSEQNPYMQSHANGSSDHRGRISDGLNYQTNDIIHGVSSMNYGQSNSSRAQIGLHQQPVQQQYQHNSHYQQAPPQPLPTVHPHQRYEPSTRSQNGYGISQQYQASNQQLQSYGNYIAHAGQQQQYSNGQRQMQAMGRDVNQQQQQQQQQQTPMNQYNMPGSQYNEYGYMR